MLKLKKINAFRIIRPLAYKFETSFSIRQYISHVITVLTWSTPTGEQIISQGEATTHSEPFYNGEFDLTALAYINRVKPHLLKIKSFNKPEDLHVLLSELKFDKNNRFPIASLDIAFHDAFAQYANLPLAKYLMHHYSFPTFETLKEVPVGVSIGIKEDLEKLVEHIQKAILNGAKKIKLKIKPGKDIKYISSITKIFNGQDIKLLVDANSSYSQENPEHGKALEQVFQKVYMVEQPYGFDDLWNHAQLAANMLKNNFSAKLCMDESIKTLDSVKTLVDQTKKISGAHYADIFSKMAINIKISRVGGLTPAMQITKYCKKNGIQIMPGGMHEYIIGQAAIVAFSAIDRDFLPGDSEGSETYYPAGSITHINGVPCKALNTNIDKNLDVPSLPGLGVGSIAFDNLRKIDDFTYVVISDIDNGFWSPEWNPGLYEEVVGGIISNGGQVM